MKLLKTNLIFLIIALLFTSCGLEKSDKTDLTKATVVLSKNIDAKYAPVLLEVLQEEAINLSGVQLSSANAFGADVSIALALASDADLGGVSVPETNDLKPEGYRLFIQNSGDAEILWIVGADTRGLLYGIGNMFRIAENGENVLAIANTTDVTSSPEYAIRGHQFGYRNTANSWDAWTVEQFDQHFREHVLFGANCFENIPFQDGPPSVHMKMSREEMNLHLSSICDKYDADYWVWTPATFHLEDKEQRQAELDKHEEFYKACPRLDGVFFPGGDPGENHPKDVIPFLEDLAGLLHKYHPDAGMWISLQGFNREKVEYFFNHVKEHQPEWLKGVANGPSSPPLAIEREHLPEQYMIRSYPDLTHTVRCQYPTKNWDQAFALTLGRECTNPQPLYYAEIHNRDAVYTDGFLSYSDGVHDDVNKVIWSQMGWSTRNDPRQVMVDYCNFFFGSSVAEEAADGILALEQNWVGPLVGNPVVGETLKLWQKLESENPGLAGNWRWQQCLMRAYYDAYTQERLTYEKNLEAEANEILAKASEIGADKAMEQALAHVQKADSEPVAQELKAKAVEYIDALYESIGLQTSVPKHNARGYERGCVLDFIDYPLNNRWWLEDEFKKVAGMATEEEKIAYLDFIRTYDNPGEGSFYDNISSADAKHVVSETDDAIDYLWEENGFSRKRLSTQLFQFSPVLEYDELDPQANYLIRVSGYGEALLRANGERLKPTKYEKGYEQFKEFPLPSELIKDGKLKITFDRPDEDHLNWRQQSRVTDVWILKLASQL